MCFSYNNIYIVTVTEIFYIDLITNCDITTLGRWRRRKWRQIDPLENYKKCPGRVGCGLNLTRGYRDGREYNTERC